MKYRSLGNTGLKISELGFGAAGLGNIYRELEEADGTAAVHAAIDGGINYFDVAPLYGLTLAETRLGKALAGKRDQVILATKCCRDNFAEVDFSAERVTASLEESLQRLQTDFVDIYQIHDVEFGTADQVLNEAIPAALALKRSGKTRFVGITGLPVRYLRKVAEQAPIDTLLSWGHYNLIEDELDEQLTPLCQQRGIGLMNASPLLQGLLCDSPPPPWHRSPAEVLKQVPRISDVCRNAGFDTATVALQHAIRYPHVATTIVSMHTIDEVERNMRALDQELPAELMERVAEVAAPIKNRMWFEGRPENNIPPSDPQRYVPQTPSQTHE